jgi:hypothetical protein
LRIANPRYSPALRDQSALLGLRLRRATFIHG